MTPAPSEVTPPDTTAQGSRLRRSVRRLAPRRVPVRMQMSTAECGAACLAMILSYHGRNTRTAECRAVCDAGRNGLSGRALSEAARSFGLNMRALKVPVQLVAEIAVPAIAYWKRNHYVVVERVTSAHVDIVDPAMGRRRITREEFAEDFSGIVLELTPTTAIQKRRRTPNPIWPTLAEHARRSPELKGVLLQILAASVLVALASLGFPVAMQILVDRILPLGETDLVPVIGYGVLAVAATVLVASFLRQALLVFAQARLDEQLMTDFFRHMLSLPLRYFQQRTTGDLIMRLTSNTQIREVLANQTASALIDGALAVFFLLFLVSLSPPIAAFVLVVGVVHVTFLVSSTRYMHRLMARELADQAESQAYLVDAIMGIATVKASGAEWRVWEHWGGLFRRHLDGIVLRLRLSAAVMAVGRTIQLSVPVAVLWLGWRMVVQGQLSLGALLALAGVTAAFLGPLTSLVSFGLQLQLAGAYAERLADVLQSPPEQADPPRQSHSFEGHLEVRNIVFRYDQFSPPALQDVSLEVLPGKRIAIVGATGSGKSTLAMVLLTLLEPEGGELLYDGVPVQEMNYQLLRRNFGAVLQDAPTLDGTIREILSWQCAELTEEDMVRAARIACLDADIAAMPMGYDTRVGERGHALSGGQRQRLAIARAVAHRPRLLVLDETTSNLDAATEAEVTSNLNALQCTQIVIAHRISTVVDADEILVMENGRIRARGTDAELQRSDEVYRRLMNAQRYAGGVATTLAAAGNGSGSRSGSAQRSI